MKNHVLALYFPLFRMDIPSTDDPLVLPSVEISWDSWDMISPSSYKSSRILSPYIGDKKIFKNLFGIFLNLCESSEDFCDSFCILCMQDADRIADGDQPTEGDLPTEGDAPVVSRIMSVPTVRLIAISVSMVLLIVAGLLVPGLSPQGWGNQRSRKD